jgi:cytochrome P450
VICDLLGIPPQARTDVREWVRPLPAGGVGTFEAYASAARRMLAFTRDLIDQKRREPADDLLTALIDARDGDDRLTEDELTSMVYLLFIAGTELARLEGRTALRALTERFPTLELATEPAALEREPSLLFNKLRALPVRVP